MNKTVILALYEISQSASIQAHERMPLGGLRSDRPIGIISYSPLEITNSHRGRASVRLGQGWESSKMTQVVSPCMMVSHTCEALVNICVARASL